MLIYILVLLFLVICAYKYDFGSEVKGKNFFFFLAFFSLTLISGLRYRIGVDTLQYEQWFDYRLSELAQIDQSDLSIKNAYGPLFVLLASLVKSLGGNWVTFQLVHSLVLNCSIFVFFKRYSSKCFTAIAIYYLLIFYQYNCEILRQSLAIAVYLFSMPFLLEKKYMKYIIVVLIASLFHIAALIALLIPLFLSIKNNNKFFILACALFLIQPMLIGTFQNYLELLNKYFQFTDRITSYIDNNEAFNLNIFGYLATFLRFVVLYWICLKALDVNSHFYKLRIVVYLYIILAILQISMPFLYRLMWMFEIIPILFLAEYLGLCVKKKFYTLRTYNLRGIPSIIFNRGFVNMIIVSLCLLSLITSRCYQEEGNGSRFYVRFIPYSSVIDSRKIQERENILWWYGRDY